MGFEAYFNGQDCPDRRVRNNNFLNNMQTWAENTLGEIGHIAEDAILKMVGGMV
jgi:hypothetical protein